MKTLKTLKATYHKSTPKVMNGIPLYTAKLVCYTEEGKYLYSKFGQIWRLNSMDAVEDAQKMKNDLMERENQ